MVCGAAAMVTVVIGESSPGSVVMPVRVLCAIMVGTDRICWLSEHNVAQDNFLEMRSLCLLEGQRVIMFHP